MRGRTLLDLLRDGAYWIKLSAPNRFDDPAPPYPSLASFARALVDAAPHRMLWGRDWPPPSFHGAMPSDAALLDALALWAPEPGTQRRILVDNPARLYGFAGSNHPGPLGRFIPEGATQRTGGKPPKRRARPLQGATPGDRRPRAGADPFFATVRSVDRSQKGAVP